MSGRGNPLWGQLPDGNAPVEGTGRNQENRQSVHAPLDSFETSPTYAAGGMMPASRTKTDSLRPSTSGRRLGDAARLIARPARERHGRLRCEAPPVAVPTHATPPPLTSPRMSLSRNAGRGRGTPERFPGRTETRLPAHRHASERNGPGMATRDSRASQRPPAVSAHWRSVGSGWWRRAFLSATRPVRVARVGTGGHKGRKLHLMAGSRRDRAARRALSDAHRPRCQS